jgi:hypothetical protein
LLAAEFSNIFHNHTLGRCQIIAFYARTDSELRHASPMQNSDGGQGPPSLLSIRLINRTSWLWFASQGGANREVSLHKDPILKVKG